MSQHEGFEKWARSEGLISESHGVRFVNSQCDVAQKAWQASRIATLEEAAVACDQVAESQGGDAGCANAIRALAKGEGE